MTSNTSIANEYFAVQPFRILLGGYININVVEGSAFFLAGFLGMCARHPGVTADLVTANPIRQTEVLDEVLGLSNASILDPYADPIFQSMPDRPTGDWMSRENYARCLGRAYDSGHYDAVLIRDNEVADHFVRLFPSTASSVTVYVTGLTFNNTAHDSATISALSRLATTGTRFACQTQAIQQILLAEIPTLPEERTFVLPPHVPDGAASLPTLPAGTNQRMRLAYTGKFYEAWNTDKILAGFKVVHADNPGLTLEVAGGEFKQSPRQPSLVGNIRYLLETTPGVTWHGKVPRRRSRQIIAMSDVGVGWRAPELDQSTELSTKILEYGALGKPSILNRTPLHEALLGDDYPLFVNSMTEYIRLLSDLPDMSAEVAEAARRSFAVSKPHWYSNVIRDVLPRLGNRVPEPLAATEHFPADKIQSIGTTVHNMSGYATLWGNIVTLNEPETGGPSARESLTALQAYIDWHREVAQVTSETIHVESQSFSETSKEASTAAISDLTDTSNRLRKENDLLREQARVLELELRSARHRAESTHQALQKLQNSTFGRVQRWFWRLWRFMRR